MRRKVRVAVIAGEVELAQLGRQVTEAGRRRPRRPLRDAPKRPSGAAFEVERAGAAMYLPAETRAAREVARQTREEGDGVLRPGLCGGREKPAVPAARAREALEFQQDVEPAPPAFPAKKKRDLREMLPLPQAARLEELPSRLPVEADAGPWARGKGPRRPRPGASRGAGG